MQIKQPGESAGAYICQQANNASLTPEVAGETMTPRLRPPRLASVGLLPLLPRHSRAEPAELFKSEVYRSNLTVRAEVPSLFLDIQPASSSTRLPILGPDFILFVYLSISNCLLPGCRHKDAKVFFVTITMISTCRAISAHRQFREAPSYPQMLLFPGERGAALPTAESPPH